MYLLYASPERLIHGFLTQPLPVKWHVPLGIDLASLDSAAHSIIDLYSPAQEDDPGNGAQPDRSTNTQDLKGISAPT